MSAQKQWHHSHPFTVLYNLKSFWAFLLVPLIRGITALLSGDLRAWLSGAWIDALVLVVMVALSTMVWRCISYSFQRDCLYLRYGILYSRSLSTPKERVVTLSAVRSFYLRPLSVVLLRADTAAGTKSESDFSLFLSKKEAMKILESDLTRISSKPVRQYRPHNLYILALSVFSSSSAAGVFFLATLVSQTGSLLGQEFADRVVGTFERLLRILAFGLPPAAAAVAYVLLGGWLVAFLFNFLRHKNFLLRRGEGQIHVTSGIFTIREYAIEPSLVNFLDIRRTVLSCILGFATVSINAIGYAKFKDDVTGVIPAVRNSDMQKTISMFFPEFRPTPRKLHHNPGALFKFIGDPFWPCALIPIVAFFLRYWLPSWGSFILWVGLMLMAPALWFMIVRLIDYFTSGISREGDTLTLRYSSGYYLHTVVLPISRLSTVKLRQSPIQYFDGKCDLLVYSYSEDRHRHHIRNLDRNKVRELLSV